MYKLDSSKIFGNVLTSSTRHKSQPQNNENIISLHNIQSIPQTGKKRDENMAKEFQEQGQTAQNKSFQREFRVGENCLVLFLGVLVNHEAVEPVQFDDEDADV